MNKKSVSRTEKEATEPQAQIMNDVPENKLQTTQQIATTEDAIKTEAPKSSFSATKEKAKGATLKQEQIADMISGSANSAGMGIGGGGRSVSGTNGGVLGANNSTPIAGKSRADSRVGKKLDRTATKLNYTPSEQVILAVDESKPLADAGGEDQGYNGTYRNESARSQKIMGAVPGDLMFQRSVDLITKDKLYFVEGQQVFQVSGDKTNLNPTLSNFGEEDPEENHDVTYHSGNFLHRALHYGLDDNGQVDYFYADVEDLTPSGTIAPEVANSASAHRLIKSNVAEIDRQVMDTKAGDEKAELWSDLPRAIPQPTQTSYLLSSIEAETGAYAHLAYSKASTNMAYQLNRGPKDGLNELGPAVEQMIGWRKYGENDGTVIEAIANSNLQNLFDKDCYRAGDPSLMIAAYDSPRKYSNKADLLLQPRGYRMHLQTADNNINPLKVPREYANVFAGQEVFSTIDHEYDPVLPICMTDRANLITVHNFNEFEGFYNETNHYQFKYSSTNIESDYKYKEIILLNHTVLNALNRNGETYYVFYKKTAGDGLDYNVSTITLNADSGNLTDATIDIIILHDDVTPTGYTRLGSYTVGDTFDLTLNLPVVQNEGSGLNDNRISAVSVTKHEKQTVYFKDAGPFAYSYSDLRNIYTINVRHPLIEGIKEYLNNSIGGKFASLLGQGNELYIPMIFSTQYMTLAQLIICAATPWITRVRLNSMKDVIYYEDNIHEYPYSKLDSIKNVPFHNYVNFEFNGYDEPLKTKVMNPTVALQWVMPEFFWKVGEGKYVLPWYFNENEFVPGAAGEVINPDASAMSFPSIRSGIRLGSLDIFYSMTEKDVRLSLDRMTKQLMLKDSLTAWKVYKYGKNTDGQPYVELDNGDYFSIFDYLSCPRELGLTMDAPYGIFDNKTELTAEVLPSFSIKIWVNNETEKDPSILSAKGVNITRAANFVQKWMKLDSSDANSDTVLAGLVFGMNDEGAGVYKPFGAPVTGTQYLSGPEIISLQRSLWTRLQMLPFVISPFDGHKTGDTGVRDIYDIAYMFGLCGFRASDYRESVYNREKEVINQGLLFVQDPWVENSPIMRESAHSTNLGITKGYEIKKD